MEDSNLEYENKINKIFDFLSNENKNITLNEIELFQIKNSIIGMDPKIVGTFLEQILKVFYNLNINDNVNDKCDGNHQTLDLEIKSSRVIYTDKTMEYLNQYEFLLNYKRRLLSLKELKDFKFDCNIQQVKPEYFDKIYYGILTNEGFIIFKMNKKVLLEEKKIAYSNKQHRGNVGEGQFHITNSNIEHHLLYYNENCISWHNILEILKKIDYNKKKK